MHNAYGYVDALKQRTISSYILTIEFNFLLHLFLHNMLSDRIHMALYYDSMYALDRRNGNFSGSSFLFVMMIRGMIWMAVLSF